jgi:hypothetical protein
MPLSLDGTTGISASGNITGGNVIASGSLVVGSFAPASVSTAGNVTGGNILTAGIMSSTGNGIHGNILTAGLISATGNITGGNILGGANVNATTLTGTTVSVTANVTGGNILTAGLISATSTITSAANVIGGNLTTGGQVSATANITGGNILTGGLISATGTITSAGNLSLTGNIVDGGELWINTSSNGNINLNPNGTGSTNIPVGVLSVTANVQGGNIRTAGLISATGAITTGGDISITGNIVDGAALTIITSSNGNITLAPNGTGVVVVNTDIRNGQANGVGNIGSSTNTFNTVFARSTSALYADLAENYVADANYTPGTVLEFGGDKEVTQTTSNHRTQVAGIASTNPSYLMNAGISGDKVVAVALTGRVPCYVIGNIVKGDRLVSSDTLGVATALDMTQYQPGCIIGKAMENYNSQEIGIIEVAVGRF